MATVITQAKLTDVPVLSEIGRLSFIESHGTSAQESDINSYVKKAYNHETIKAEIENPENNYYLIIENGTPAGFSKMQLNTGHSNIQLSNVCKLDRIYLLKEFYNLNLGRELLNFNLELAKQNNQSGMWLFVWKDNTRAVNFYKKLNFEVIGTYEFKLTETHSNPNYQMLLKW
ncbi:MAG TPA: N-acetyltransferase [Bacteroidia bacterium]|nr:N-acetyltransferase [Bacteroidia bacterium]